MSEIPEPVALVSADITLWQIRRSASHLCTDANNLCNAIDRLDEIEFDTEAEAALNNAVTAMEFALSAAEEKRIKLLSKRTVNKFMAKWDALIEEIA